MKSYSQFGEDLILSNFFNKVGLSKGFFFEFGAWDGIYLSNCRIFFENGWSGCFVEGDKKKFVDLKKNYNDDKNILLLNEFINTNDNTLDKIVKKNNIKEIDLLSIDIDGNDLSVWKTLTKIKPKFVIIEFNKFIPFDVSYEDNTKRFIGNSILAIHNHAISIDYELVEATHTNLIFIDRSFNNKKISTKSFFEIFNSLNPVRVGYNWKGETLFFEENKLIFKEYYNNPLQKSYITFQPMPKFIRKLSDIDGSGFKKIKLLYSFLILLALRPNLFISKIIYKIKKLIKK